MSGNLAPLNSCADAESRGPHFNPIDVVDGLEALGLGDKIDDLCDRFLLMPPLSKRDLLPVLLNAKVVTRDQAKLIKHLSRNMAGAAQVAWSLGWY